MEKYCRAGQNTDDNMAHAHCMLDTQDYKYTHSGCVILIAFPLQHWLHERASKLLSTYIACIVLSNVYSSINRIRSENNAASISEVVVTVALFIRLKKSEVLQVLR